MLTAMCFVLMSLMHLRTMMMISSQRSGRIYLVENSPGITKMGKSIWYLSWEDGGAKFHLVLNFLVCTRLSLRSLSMFKFSSSLAKYIVHTYMWRLIWKYQKRRYLFGTGYLVLTYTVNSLFVSAVQLISEFSLVRVVNESGYK